MPTGDRRWKKFQKYSEWEHIERTMASRATAMGDAAQANYHTKYANKFGKKASKYKGPNDYYVPKGEMGSPMGGNGYQQPMATGGQGWGNDYGYDQSGYGGGYNSNQGWSNDYSDASGYYDNSSWGYGGDQGYNY